ncbi:MAG: hypothetical protein ACUVWV_16095 [Thermodesulfobacteriota bacterium]
MGLILKLIGLKEVTGKEEEARQWLSPFLRIDLGQLDGKFPSHDTDKCKAAMEEE